jgi:hypothetical protein
MSIKYHGNHFDLTTTIANARGKKRVKVLSIYPKLTKSGIHSTTYFQGPFKRTWTSTVYISWDDVVKLLIQAVPKMLPSIITLFVGWIKAHVSDESKPKV